MRSLKRYDSAYPAHMAAPIAQQLKESVLSRSRWNFVALPHLGEVTKAFPLTPIVVTKWQQKQWPGRGNLPLPPFNTLLLLLLLRLWLVWRKIYPIVLCEHRIILAPSDSVLNYFTPFIQRTAHKYKTVQRVLVPVRHSASLNLQLIPTATVGLTPWNPCMQNSEWRTEWL